MLSLAAVKQTAIQLDITVNDLVLAMAAGALRRLLLRHDGRADEPLVASVLARGGPGSLPSEPADVTG